MGAISSDWSGRGCIVVASGPSLTPEVAHQVRMARLLNRWKLIVVNDAYKRLPIAQILYAADGSWWRAHDGAKEFTGERWTCHNTLTLDNRETVAAYGLHSIQAEDGKGFSADGRYIHFGACGHSGFQAVNIALLKGSALVVLVGFDMRRVEGNAHFFGEHPPQLKRVSENYGDFVRSYSPDARIINATPGSALKCYESMDLDEALRWDDCLHWDRPKPVSATG